MELDAERDDFVSRVILQACPSGRYLGKEAQVRLNKIAELIHFSILTFCRGRSEMDLATHFYNMFDEACYNTIRGKYWKFQNTRLVYSLEAAPSAFSYLINTALFSKTDSLRKPERAEIESITELAFLLVKVCNFSDFLFYTGYDDGFEISETGALSVIQSERTRSIQNGALRKVRERRLTIQSDELWGETKSFEELSRPYDSVFEQKYGMELSEVSEIIAYGVKYNVKKLYGAISSSYRELVKRFRKGLNLPKSTVESAVRFFELDREMLHTDWRYYKLYDIRPGCSRQPIVHLSGKIGKDGTIIYGPNALLRALALLFSDLDRGIVDLGDFSKSAMQQRGLRFEREVRELLIKYDFNVLRVTNTPGHVGEIDCVAYDNMRGVLLIIEAKSPKIDLSLKDAGWQIKNTKKWCLQLFRKSEWVKANLECIAKMFKVTVDDVKEIHDIVVVSVPTFCDVSCSEKIVTIENFYHMLEAMKERRSTRTHMEH